MKQLTIASYNIRHGADVSMDWSRLAEIIRQSDADVVGIQEVDVGTHRIGGADTVAGLSETAGLPYSLFIPAMRFDGGQYGTAILSRYPILRSEICPLDAGSFEPRAFGCTTLEMPDGSRLYFLNTHLSYESREQQALQFRQLAEWIIEHVPEDSPAVLTGDFNTEDFAAFTPLTDIGFSLVNNSTHTYKTFRSPPLAIDNVVYRATELSLQEQGMIDSDHSDHNLLWCRFEIYA